MTKLHLGCGKLKLPNFVNIDVSSNCADLCLNMNNLYPIDNNSIMEIYCCHVLEHIRRRHLVSLLLEWNRVLKIGGLLRLSVPDFEKVIKVYLNNKDLSEIIGFLNGGQKDDFDIHFVNFDINIITLLLEACGFENIRKYDTDLFLGDKDDYSKCYLPHMDTNGELMSLNILCNKVKDMSNKDVQLSPQLKKYLKM